jgi:hypothetical protein
MTEDERYEIAVLTEAYNTARQRAEYCGMINANQPTEELRLKVAIEYQIAQTERMKAWADLDRARCRIAGVE